MNFKLALSNALNRARLYFHSPVEIRRFLVVRSVKLLSVKLAANPVPPDPQASPARTGVPALLAALARPANPVALPPTATLPFLHPATLAHPDPLVILDLLDLLATPVKTDLPARLVNLATPVPTVHPVHPAVLVNPVPTAVQVLPVNPPSARPVPLVIPVKSATQVLKAHPEVLVNPVKMAILDLVDLPDLLVLMEVQEKMASPASPVNLVRMVLLASLVSVPNIVRWMEVSFSMARCESFDLVVYFDKLRLTNS